MMRRGQNRKEMCNKIFSCSKLQLFPFDDLTSRGRINHGESLLSPVVAEKNECANRQQ
jgi:hypothetical protein